MTNGDSGILVHDAAPQKLRRKLNSEGVRTATATLSGFAPFVLPVFFVEERNVHSPDRNSLAEFQPLGLVDRVAPNNILARVIVVRLQSPRTRRPFGFQCLLRRRVQFSAQRKIRKTLLSNVRMLVFLVGTRGMKSLDAENPDDSAEYIRLLKVNVDEFVSSAFDMFDGFPYMRNLELGRQ